MLKCPNLNSNPCLETAALPKGQKAELESFVGRDSSGWKFACVQRRDGVKDGAARQKEEVREDLWMW